MQILVLYYSKGGNTRRLAEAIAEGVEQVAGAEVVLRNTTNVTRDEFMNSIGVIAGSPVYFGTMAAELKKVLDDYGLVTDPKETDKDLFDLNKYYFNNKGWFGVIKDRTDHIIGTYGLFKINDTTCELRKMYLYPEYQGKGLPLHQGSQLRPLRALLRRRSLGDAPRGEGPLPAQERGSPLSPQGYLHRQADAERPLLLCL